MFYMNYFIGDVPFIKEEIYEQSKILIFKVNNIYMEYIVNILNTQEVPKVIQISYDEYNKFEERKPLVVVPSSFDSIYEHELSERGVNIIIYANQLLRSAYPAMIKTAESILKYQRALESSSGMMSIKDILELIPGGK